MNKPYLKSMDIQGFKSFANQTHIDFSPKINVILGAHETGKTNILNAIRWCLFGSLIFDSWCICKCESIKHTEVQLTFGLEENDSSDTILKHQIEHDNNNEIIKSECFINGEMIAEELFAERLFEQGFLKQKTELGNMFSGSIIDDRKYNGQFDIFISRSLTAPLCLINDSLSSAADEQFGQIITSMIKGLSETSQCIVVSQAKQIAMESDRMIGVTIEGDSSKVIEIAAEKE